jgi:hypothetical protein
MLKMAKRGRTKATKSKTKSTLGTTKSTKTKATGKSSTLANIAKSALGFGGDYITSKLTGKKGKSAGFGKKKSAKQVLKKAYEKRAMRQIRFGQLGLARKSLRKKATVV